MIDARLMVALEGQALRLPETGSIAVFNPPTDAGLNTLDQARCQIIVDTKPDHDSWSARGFDVVQSPTCDHAAAIVCLPRAKTEARAMVSHACDISAGPVIIDGQKTDGVDSLLKEVRKGCAVGGPISKAHGKLFWFDPAEGTGFADWAAGPALTDGGFWTAPGVFSADAVDPGSALLAATLPEKIKGVVADLGAGWGYLSAHVLTRPDVAAVHLVEAGHMALDCARHNVTDPRAAFHWADATNWTAPSPVDVVVMNPPFHRGRAAEPDLGQAFVASAARILGPQGQLWMVANRHLPYEAELRKRFTTVQEIGEDARFKLFHATRPQRTRR